MQNRTAAENEDKVRIVERVVQQLGLPAFDSRRVDVQHMRDGSTKVTVSDMIRVRRGSPEGQQEIAPSGS